MQNTSHPNKHAALNPNNTAYICQKAKRKQGVRQGEGRVTAVFRDVSVPSEDKETLLLVRQMSTQHSFSVGKKPSCHILSVLKNAKCTAL